MSNNYSLEYEIKKARRYLTLSEIFSLISSHLKIGEDLLPGRILRHGGIFFPKTPTYKHASGINLTHFFPCIFLTRLFCNFLLFLFG